MTYREVVVTARFRTLYVFLLMEVGTRRIVHCNDRHSFAQDCKVASRAVLGGLHHEYRWERIAA